MGWSVGSWGMLGGSVWTWDKWWVEHSGTVWDVFFSSRKRETSWNYVCIYDHIWFFLITHVYQDSGTGPYLYLNIWSILNVIMCCLLFYEVLLCSFSSKDGSVVSCDHFWSLLNPPRNLLHWWNNSDFLFGIQHRFWSCLFDVTGIQNFVIGLLVLSSTPTSK